MPSPEPIIPESPKSNMFGSFRSWFKRLPRNQKGSLLALLFIVIAIPFGVTATMNQVRVGSKASPITPPITPYPTPTPPPPTPYPTPYPATPGPTPTTNQAPVIQTSFLPSGTVNSAYQATIMATDPDAGGVNKRLSLKATGIPTGLSLTNCSYSYLAPVGKTTCSLTGKPIRTGNYQVTIIATDYRGLKTTKTIPLTILKSPTIEPQPTPIAN